MSKNKIPRETSDLHRTNIAKFIRTNRIILDNLKSRYEHFINDIIEDMDSTYYNELTINSHLKPNEFIYEYTKHTDGLDLKNAEYLYEGAIDFKIKDKAKKLIELIKRKNKEEEEND